MPRDFDFESGPGKAKIGIVADKVREMNAMDRWRIIRSVINFPTKTGGSIANIGEILPDVTRADLATLNLALSAELGKDAANAFGACLHRAFLDDEEDNDDASWAGLDDVLPRVDARHIVTTYRAALLAPAAFHDPRTVLMKLLRDYALECEAPIGSASDLDQGCWFLHDVVKTVSVAAVSDDEVDSTAGLLGDALRRLTTGSVITMDQLLEAFDSYPSVLESFRSQMVTQLTSDQRLELLDGEEDKALHAFMRQSNKVIGAKRRNFFRQKFMKRVVRAWRKDLMLVTRAKRWRKREVLVAWMTTAKLVRQSRLFTSISFLNWDKSQGRRSLRKLAKHMRNMKRIERCTSNYEKNMRAGLGHLRIWFAKYTARRALSRWVSFCIMGQNQDLAQKWNETKLVRLVFHSLQTYATSRIKKRKLLRKASIQQRKILKQIEDINSALLNKPVANEVPGSLLAKQQQAQQCEARERKVKLQRWESILTQQRSQRRERVQVQRRQREEQFQSEWAAKKAKVESSCLKRNKTWIHGSEFKNILQKQIKGVQRKIDITSMSDADRESAISNPAVIGYSILDAKMAEAGIVRDDLFRQLEKIASPINVVPFQSVLVSSGLKLAPTEFDEIFQGIVGCSYNQAEPKEKSCIEFDDLQMLRRSSDSHLGREGTRWKMYVSSIHQQQLLHNVHTGKYPRCIFALMNDLLLKSCPNDTITGKKIFEKDVRKKHIKQMVSENMQDCELLKVRRKLSEERNIAHQAMAEHHAVKSIQFMYRRWRGKESIKKQLWIVERRNLFRRRAKEANAVMLIQRLIRSRGVK